ncbi:hypothetical protein GPECTOR_7g1205 [Gonium pectorale]|uniref:Uncharacterized protein n=1 Tax=Gonium pectorale TaxID=33097 RepID=A0A150GU13_GONPE|nr:hypothetical protein GPECTOR_7g1205 [Gonium pectorale]|eukprot:KXZ53311.1 hypothetical protein GPECTOR_7g1205 [Gonium pectorale]
MAAQPSHQPPPAAALLLAAAALAAVLLPHGANATSRGPRPNQQPPAPHLPFPGVPGVVYLDPVAGVQTYRELQVSYWRTVMSKNAAESPADPTTVNRPPNFGCPKVPPQFTTDNVETYLITGSFFNFSESFPITRTCDNIPANTRVVLDLVNDVEWYSPPINSNNYPTGGVRLSPDSLASLPPAIVKLDPSCVLGTINGFQVPDAGSLFHATPFIPNMDLSAGFYQVDVAVNGITTSGPGADRLLRLGEKNTDFADAGYYIVFPKGFPKGFYVFEFGVAEGCTQPARSWWRSGTNTTSHACWPNPATCAGECETFPSGGVPSFTWRYTINVH